jgi:hypothetical protein
MLVTTAIGFSFLLSLFGIIALVAYILEFHPKTAVVFGELILLLFVSYIVGLGLQMGGIP